MTDTRIYVACLASYNAGKLHGEWIDCDDIDTMQEAVAAMLRASPEPNVTVDCPDCEGTGVAVTGVTDGVQQCEPCGTCKGAGKVASAEEYAIHDHEGFGRAVGEYTPLTRVAALAEAITEHGAPFIAYLEHLGTDSDVAEAVEEFEERYCGEWDSERAYAENLLDELGELNSIPEHLQYYFDYDAYARDLFRGGDYWRDDETGAVFRSC